MQTTVAAADALSFLDELGYSIPTVVLTPVICRVDGLDPCLIGAGYDDCTIALIKLYAVALMCISSGARRIQSQHAPSGASRSFVYGSDAIGWLRNALSGLDTAGCTSSLPITAGDNAGYFRVVGGGCD